MSEQGEPWWREEYDAHVAAYRIDDPMIDVAVDRLCSGWQPDASPRHPWDWAVDALSGALIAWGGWERTRELVTSLAPEGVVQTFESYVMEYADDELRLESVGLARVDVSASQAMVQWVVAEEYGDVGVHVGVEPSELLALARRSTEFGDEASRLARELLVGAVELDTWSEAESDARWRGRPYTWLSDLMWDLTGPRWELEVPSAPVALELFARALGALPVQEEAAVWVGCRLEDLYKLHMGAAAAWGRHLVDHRAEIIDARLGTAWSAWRALSACWLSAGEAGAVEDAWSASVARRAPRGEET